MSQHIYHLCCRYHGRPVAIRMRDGRVHRGVIRHVTPSHVRIQPLGVGISLESGHDDAVKSAIHTEQNETQGTEVFWFFPVIPLAAIAGITLIGIAGFRSRRRFWW